MTSKEAGNSRLGKSKIDAKQRRLSTEDKNKEKKITFREKEETITREVVENIRKEVGEQIRK